MSEYITPQETTNKYYPNIVPVENLTIEDLELNLYKLTSDNNINIGPLTTGLIFASFYYEQETSSIYTHDSITHILDTNDGVLDIPVIQKQTSNMWYGSLSTQSVQESQLTELSAQYVNIKPIGTYSYNCFPSGYLYFIYPEELGSVSFKIESMYTNAFYTSILTINSKRFVVYRSQYLQHSENIKLEVY